MGPILMADNFPYLGTSSKGITKEIEIPVPWGIVAGKTYGESCNPPVLCVHGWLDNCNTFDSLIPMLPKDKFYVFIDLPGNGRSSKIPAGCLNAFYNYSALFHRIVEYFSWPYFSFLSHSLGGRLSSLYAGTFPEKVDKLIFLDSPALHPVSQGGDVRRLRSSIESYIKFEKNVDKVEPTYSYKEAKEKLLKANKSLTGPAADILLERGTARQEDGTYKFVRDVRQYLPLPTVLNIESGLGFLSCIRAEALHIIATDGLFRSLPSKTKEIADKVMEEGFRACEYHNIVTVDGLHHVHLCEPDKVIGHISAMLNRPIRSGLLKNEDLLASRL